MNNPTALTSQIDRSIRAVLRNVDLEQLPIDQRKVAQKLKPACNEVRLDVRDYSYAQTRDEQLKWMKLARHNLKVLESLILRCDSIFGPVDTAELSAMIESLRDDLK